MLLIKSYTHSIHYGWHNLDMKCQQKAFFAPASVTTLAFFKDSFTACIS